MFARDEQGWAQTAYVKAPNPDEDDHWRRRLAARRYGLDSAPGAGRRAATRLITRRPAGKVANPRPGAGPPVTTPEPGRIEVFQYVTVEKAADYRAVMGVFVAEKEERFGLYLRPRDVAAHLGHLAPAEVEQVLQKLCDWGNLEMHHDTAAVSTIEEFNRPRWLYQMSVAGEAAEHAIAAYQEVLGRPGELQTVALADIGNLLGELLALISADEVDEAKVHLHLRSLCDRFDELTERAQTFIRSLQRAIDLRDTTLDTFIAYKQSLIDYLKRFIGQLVVAAADIAGKLAAFSPAARDRMLDLAAARDAVGLFAATAAQREEIRARWHRRWDGLRRWFVPSPHQSSQAEVLRGQALAAIPRLLRVVEAIHERRIAQSDRVNDLRILARWFAEADSEAEAHRLWRAAFGLSSARHLRIDEDTQDLWQSGGVAASTAWSAAPPLRISPRLRATGSHVRRGRPENVVDHSEEKAVLAAAAAREAEQIELARERLATGQRTRLSELGVLDALQFGMFLELLGEALTRQTRSDRAVEITSSDGSLEILLEPIGDGSRATVRTSDGEFSGEDHYLTIRDASGGAAEARS